MDVQFLTFYHGKMLINPSDTVHPELVEGYCQSFTTGSSAIFKSDATEK
jgi:hypothetical protein